MKIDIKIVCILLLVSKFSYSQFANQNLSSLTINSPNASNLGSYGDLPVNLSTGAVNISVPITSFQEKGVSLDINLQHNSRGVRITDIPGWVGQNWSLNAGGVITRSVRGTTFDELDYYWNTPITSINDLNSTTYKGWPYPDGIGSTPDDEFYVGTNKENVLQRGFYFNRNLLLNISNSEITDLACRIHQWFWNTTAAKYRDYLMDFEPDVFYFNFMEHTGKFFLGNDGKWKVISDSNLKVFINFTTDLGHPVPTINYPDNQFTYPFIRYPRVIQKITLLDEKGNKYFFGLRESERELTFNNLFSQTVSYVPIGQFNKITSTAWYLSRVVDQFDNILFDFEYERGPYVGQIMPNYTRITSSNATAGTAPISPDYPIGFASQTIIKAPSQLILPCYLKKIKTYSGIEINFTSSIANSMKYTFNDNTFLNTAEYAYGNIFSNSYYTDRSPQDLTTVFHEPQNSMQQIFNRLQWKKLDSILIKDNKSANQNITFDYNNVPQERLFLNSVTTNNLKKYEFEYYNKNLLPNYLSTAIDHFGYFKNTRFNFTPLTDANPSINFWSNQYYLERETHPEFVKYGSLTKIIYPTGGYSEFEFEAHSFSKEFGGTNGGIQSLGLNKIIGGLRIKKIKDFDLNGNEKTREYQYTTSLNSTISSGILTKKPVYFDTFYLNHGCPINNVLYFNKASINNLIPLTNLSGTHIEYSNVIEKFNNNGYIVYKYTDYFDYPDLLPQSPLSANYWKHLTLTDYSIFRGKLKEKETFNQNNFRVKKESNTYHFINESIAASALNYTFFELKVGNSIAKNSHLNGLYKILYTDLLLKESKVETFFENSQSIVELAKFDYHDYHFPEVTPFGDSFITSKKVKNSTTSSSGDDYITTTYKYPFDSYEEDGDNISYNMIMKRNLSPVEINTYKINYSTSGSILSQHHLQSEKNIFSLFDMYNEDNNLVQIPVENEFLLSRDNQPIKSIYKIELRDEIGNILQVKENQTLTSYIWGYNRTKLIAKIENTAYSQVSSFVNNLQTLSNGTDEAALLVALNNLRISLPNAMVTTFTYKPLVGLTSITDSKADIITYHYDVFGRLEFVKDRDNKILSENKYNYKQ